MRSKTRQEKRQIDKIAIRWHKRITRRLLERGITPTYLSKIGLAAYDIALRQFYPHTSNLFMGTDNLPDKVTLRQVCKENKVNLSTLFDDVEQFFVYGYQDPDSYRDIGWQEYAAEIPYCEPAHNYDPPAVSVANYRVITETYKDLFAYGILEETYNGVRVYVDRPHHSIDRINELFDDLKQLRDYPILDEQAWSDEKSRREAKTRESYLYDFIDALEIESDLSTVLFGEELRDWAYPEDTKTFTPITRETILAHMDQLMDEQNLEYGDDSTYMDVLKIAPHSPLYKLGQLPYIRIGQLHEKIETTGIVNPSLASFVSQVCADIEHGVYEGKLMKAFYAV